MIRYNSVMTFFAVALAGLILFSLGACVTVEPTSSTIKALSAGEQWIVPRTVHLTELTIAPGAVIKGPPETAVTLTVDGVETGLVPGAYRGTIVLAVTPEMVVTHRGKKFSERAAVAVENGKYAKEKSVTSAVTAGTVTDSVALDVKITSTGDDFSGIIVRGATNPLFYVLRPVIRLSGKGSNDLAGGAGIMSEGTAKVSVKNASIINRGVNRPGILVRENSVMKIDNSVIETYTDDIPEEKTTSALRAPGLAGHIRSVNVVGSGTADFFNTHLKSRGVGVLTTTDADGARISATRCRIETVDGGYGAYVAGNCLDTFSACTFTIDENALILAEKDASALFTGGSVVNSKRAGVIIHSDNTGSLTIESGTTFNTSRAVIQVKNAFPTILVDDATLNSSCGLILQAMDDPESIASGAVGPDTCIDATFRNMTLAGDMVSSMTSRGDLNITLDNATLTGAISTAVQKRRDEGGREYAPEVKELMKAHAAEYKALSASDVPADEVKQIFASTDDQYGIRVTLNHATWVVEETSYLTGLTIAKGSVMRAPRGHHLILTVDGVQNSIKTGKYRGKIVIAVKR